MPHQSVYPESHREWLHGQRRVIVSALKHEICIHFIHKIFGEWMEGKNPAWYFSSFMQFFKIIILFLFLFVFKAQLRWFKLFHGTRYYFRLLLEFPCAAVYIYLSIIIPGIT